MCAYIIFNIAACFLLVYLVSIATWGKSTTSKNGKKDQKQAATEPERQEQQEQTGYQARA